MDRLPLSALVVVAFCFGLGCDSCNEKKSEDPVRVVATPVRSVMLGPTTAAPQCTKLCRAVGKCSFRDGKCYASSVHDCRGAFGCKAAGFCSLHEEMCEAVTDADCEESEVCKVHKKCVPREGRCVEAVSKVGDAGAP